MTIVKLLIGILLTVAGHLAFANNWYDRGNGGFVLACGSQPLKVLDIYETEKRYFFNIVYSNKTTVEEKAKEILSRLNGIDPVRASTYLRWLKNFYQESQILTDTEFTETPDLGLVKKPKDCGLEQVIFQREPSRLSPARYIINQTVWNQLDADNQAALIIHELIYRDFLSGMALETSERIRLFNAFLLGDKLKVMNLQEYIRLLQQDLHISTYTYSGVALFLGATDTVGRWRPTMVQFHDADKIWMGPFAANQTMQKQGLTYFCISAEENPNGGSVTFTADGNISNLRLATTLEDNPLCSYPAFDISSTGNQTFKATGNVWEFDANGKVSLVLGTTAKSVSAEIEYKNIKFERGISLDIMPRPETYYRFDGDGNLRELSLGGNPCLTKESRHVRFEPSTSTRVWTVLLSKTGTVENKLHTCNF